MYIHSVSMYWATCMFVTCSEGGEMGCLHIIGIWDERWLKRFKFGDQKRYHMLVFLFPKPLETVL